MIEIWKNIRELDLGSLWFRNMASRVPTVPNFLILVRNHLKQGLQIKKFYLLMEIFSMWIEFTKKG